MTASWAPIRSRDHLRARVVTATQYLLARVITLLALEPLLVLVSPLVLNEGVALMEASGTVATLHFHGAVAMQVAQMDTCESRGRHRTDLWHHGCPGTSLVRWEVLGTTDCLQHLRAPPTTLACLPQRWQTASISW